MRIRTKLILFLLSIISIFFAALFIHNANERKTLNLFFADRNRMENKTFDEAMETKGVSLKTLAFDYTYWDEMVNFLKTDNQAWAEENINQSALSNFKANAIWIYKLDLSLAYAVTDLKDSHFKNIPLPAGAIPKIFLKERFCHFFLNTPQGLMEIRGATIHPSNDPERKTAPQGYFFAGRLWDKAFMEELSSLTDSTIVVSPVQKEKFTSNINQGIIAFSRILNGWDNLPVARLDIRVRVGIMQYLMQTYQRNIFLFFLFALIFVIFQAVSLTRLINKPLKSISLALDKEDPDYLGSLKREKNEFGEISRLIDKFFQQRDILAKEISQRKHTEVELRSAYDKLQQTQRQLIQSAKMASIGQFASGLAHEINSPLTGVLNNLQLMKNQILKEDGFSLVDFKEGLESIEESAARCKDVIRSLLDFSRSSRGPFQFLSLNEVIQKTLLLVEHEIQLEKIILQIQLQPALPKILGDAQLLQQAVFDIISNARWAIKEAKKQGGVITLQTKYEPQDKTVFLSISDTGIGIPAQNLERIFEPFFTTKPAGEGTGLGLSIVYNIIKEHKGSIEAESKLGEGTTVKITLPCLEEA